MNDSTLAREIREAIDGLKEILASIEQQDRNGKNLQERMRDAQVGQLRSPSLDAGSTPERPDTTVPPELRGRTNYSDPTGAAGVQIAMTGDQARDDLKNLERFGKRIAKDVRIQRDAAARYNPRIANILERQQEAEPGCVSCARIPGPGTVGLPKSQRDSWWNEPTRNTTLSDGRRVSLCNFCYEAREIGARWTGELPPVTEVEYLRDNGRPRKRTA